MHRAWQRLLTCAALAAALFALPSPASAFHAGSVFDKPPGAGGGGGIFYTGAPLEHGWECTLCHLDPPGKVSLRMKVDPPDLFETFAYVPGQTYTFTATLEGESLGLGSPLSNYNALAVSITDEEGLSTGEIGGFVPEDFYAGNLTTIASAGQKVGQTEWTFSYTAPPEPAGKLLIHLAAVDGNGADSPPGGTLTDPFGDDVFTGVITLEQGTTAGSPPPPSPARPGPPLSGDDVALALLAAVIALAAAGRRRIGPATAPKTLRRGPPVRGEADLPALR